MSFQQTKKKTGCCTSMKKKKNLKQILKDLQTGVEIFTFYWKNFSLMFWKKESLKIQVKHYLVKRRFCRAQIYLSIYPRLETTNPDCQSAMTFWACWHEHIGRTVGGEKTWSPTPTFTCFLATKGGWQSTAANYCPSQSDHQGETQMSKQWAANTSPTWAMQNKPVGQRRGKAHYTHCWVRI